MKLVKTILDEMMNVSKWQKIFFETLVQTVIAIPAHINFSSLSRYSGMPEKRFQRWFKRGFDFCTFNSKAISMGLNRVVS